VVYWLFFKIEFFEIIKIESKKIKIRRNEIYKSSQERLLNFKFIIVATEIIDETIN
jgi:hypothetical protein